MLRAEIPSVAQLAERSGVNRTHLYTLWQAEGSSSLDTVRRVARALRVSLAALVGDEPPPPSPAYPGDVRAVADRLSENPVAARHLLRVMDALAPAAPPQLDARDSPNALRIFGLDPVDGRVQKRRGKVVPLDPRRVVPRGRAAANPGGGAINDDADAPEREIPQHYWEIGARLVFKAEGDSMRDAGITHRDLLFVRPETDAAAAHGRIVVCAVGAAEFVKRLFIEDDVIRLESANERYSPMVVGESGGFRLIGVVVGRSGYVPE
jgi:transcriptional regulator with XRE-family HTH domain